jgi:hypothetical protein
LQSLESYLPNNVLVNNFLGCFVFVYHLEYISTLQALGYYAKAVAKLIIE